MTQSLEGKSLEELLAMQAELVQDPDYMELQDKTNKIQGEQLTEENKKSDGSV